MGRCALRRVTISRKEDRVVSRDDLNFYATMVGALFAVLAFLFSFLVYLRSRSRRLVISSRLELVDGKPSAVVSVTSTGQAPTVIQSVALSLTVWDNNKPRLIVPWPMKVLRVLDDLANHEAAVCYPSDHALTAATPTLPTTLSEHQSASVTIDLRRFADEFVARGGGFSNRGELAFWHLVLRIVISTPTRIYSSFAHREIRYFLWKEYAGGIARMSGQADR
jgi:hypothetical protein